MKAIILAGGMGTRLRDTVRDIPKPMACVMGKPFLEYLLQQLKKWGIMEVVLSVGYRKEKVKAYFGDGGYYGMSIVYSEENEPLGTGGALKKAVSVADDPLFIVMNGDSFFNVDLSKLISYHELKEAATTISLAYVKDKSRYGGVKIDYDGRIIFFEEKGTSGPGLINGGVYVIRRDIADDIPQGPISLEREVLSRLKEKKQLYAMEFRGFFIDMGLPEDYVWINRHPEHLAV